MRTALTYVSNVLKNIHSLPAIIIALFLPVTASATVIDFDELTLANNSPDAAWYDNPLNEDEYLDQGIRIYGGWLAGTSSNIEMLAGTGAKLEFLSNLPTFISMNVTSYYGDDIFLTFYGESGYLSTMTISDWQNSDENSSPIIPSDLISFSSDVGIKSISISSFYGMRIKAEIDNITFTNTPVPEPSSIAFICLGLLGLLLRRSRTQQQS